MSLASHELEGDSLRPAPERALDLAHLSRQCFGDAALERELLALFDRQAAAIAAQLGAGGGDALARADLAHKLKGSARAVGAHAVASAAEFYEILARTGRNEADAAARLAAAVAEVRAVLSELAL